jgi:hypothetical protein
MFSRYPSAIFVDRKYFVSADGAKEGRLPFLTFDDLLVFVAEMAGT